MHGNGAHAHWWDFIAPAFADRYDVIALDMSGAGDSDHRSRYTPSTFAREILEVGRHAGIANPLIVGHSFGGAMSRIAGYLHGDQLAGIILVDSAIFGERGRRRPPRAPRTQARYYESLEEAVRRFRLRPPQPCANQYIVDYIARHSVRKTERGWCFKMDRAMFSKMSQDYDIDFPDGLTMLQEIPCKTALIYGTLSRFFAPVQIAGIEPLFGPGLIEGINDAHHHVFLDQPLAFIDSLGRILEQFP